MKDSARYLTTRIRVERIRDYASATHKIFMYSDTKSVTMTIIGLSAARAAACTSKYIRHLPSVQ
jgi:hypothetical protein